MRKHFLLLFLMALLPLAGWAQAVFPANAEITGLGDYTFTGANQKNAIINAAKVTSGTDDLTAGADIDIYLDAACTSVATTVTNAGTYYVGAYGNGVNYSATSLVKKSFTVAQKQITVTAGAVNVKFGDLIDDDDFTVTFSAWGTGSDGTTTTLDSSVSGDITFTSNYIAGTTAVGAASIVITPVVTGLSATNYSFTASPGAVTVQARAFSADFVTLSATSVTYNAANQRPTITVQEAGEDIAPTNYTIAWKDPTSTAIDETNWDGDDYFKTAGTYTVTVTGKNNYAATAVEKTFVIDRKTLYVKTKTLSKTYDAITVVPAANGTYLKFTGLEGNDVENYTDLQVALGDVDGLTEGFDAGTYPINVTGQNDFANNVLSANYNIQLGSVGTYTINKKAITITANNASKKWDNSAASDGYTAGKLATACATTSTTAGTAKLDVALATGDAFTTLPTLKRTAGETAGPYDLTPSAAIIKNNNGSANNDNDDFDVTKNYEITYTPGTFTITAVGFTIWADDKTSKFGEDIVPLTATVVGIPAADAAKIVYNEGAITTTATSSANRGKYPITIDKTKIDFSQIEALYDIDAVTVVEGEYEITPAPLKIKAKNQSHKTGDVVTAASLDNIEFVTEGVSEADKADVVAKITLGWGGHLVGDTHYTAATGALLDAAAAAGWDGEAATTDGIWVGSIVINATTYNGSLTANYTLDPDKAAGAEAAAGDLYASTGTYVTFDATGTGADLVSTKLADNNNKTINVKVVLRRDQTVGGNAVTWSAEQWNTMVLPFDISVAKLSQALGYAIVNVVKPEATTGDKVKFQLEMKNIPANTPFAVKTTDAITDAQVIDFGLQTIKYDANPAVDAGADNIFHGAYTAMDITSANPEYRFCAGNVWPHISQSGSKFVVRPFNAYMEIDDANLARDIVFEFEEIDGSTTAIKSVDLGTVKAYNVDGWYTIDGKKLNAAPTEKGIYINNGKKVVVK